MGRDRIGLVKGTKLLKMIEEKYLMGVITIDEYKQILSIIFETGEVSSDTLQDLARREHIKRINEKKR